MKIKKILLFLLLCSLTAVANKRKDYYFINNLVNFSLENNINMSKEVRTYIDYVKETYQDDKIFLDILESRYFYSRRSYKEAKKVISSIPISASYYYDVNYDLYKYSKHFKDKSGIKLAITNIFKQGPSLGLVKKIGRNNFKRIAQEQIIFLTEDQKRRELAVFKAWLKKNRITVEELSDIGGRLQYWQTIIKEVNSYEEKYLGLYELKNVTIEAKVKEHLNDRIKSIMSEERKKADRITSLILMEVARIRLIMGEYKTAERLIADNFNQLKAEHETVYVKNKEISPFLTARYVLGLCYLVKAKSSYDSELKKQAKALLMGGSKIYKNGAAQNFFYILKEKVDSFYKWKAFDRYEYATRPKLKEWFGIKIPSLLTSKTYGFENISRLFTEKRYELLLKNASLILSQDKFSSLEKLEIYKDVLATYVHLGKFSEVRSLRETLEKTYVSPEELKDLGNTYQYIGKIAYNLRKNSDDKELNKKYNNILYEFFERALKIDKTNPRIAELVYFLAADQYEIYIKSESKNEEALLRTLKYCNIIINNYPSYVHYVDTIYWTANIYVDLLNKNLQNETLADKYKKKVLATYKLYLTKSANASQSRANKIYSLYGIASLLITDTDILFEKEGFVYYAKQFHKELEKISSFTFEEQERLKKLLQSMYRDEISVYQERIDAIQFEINRLNSKLSQELVKNEIVKAKKELQKQIKLQKKFLASIIEVMEKALKNQYYKKKQDQALYELASYYSRLEKREESEEKYSLLLEKYPQSPLSKSIIFREVDRLITKNQLEKAANEFDKLKDNLFTQNDQVQAKWFNNFYFKIKPHNMKEVVFEKVIQLALFCAEARLKKLTATENRKRNIIRMQIANCYYSLKNYTQALSFVEKIITNKGAGFYQALLLKGQIYKTQNNPKDAFQVYGTLYTNANNANVDDLIKKQKEWDAQTKKIKSKEFKRQFELLKYSSLASTIELAYQIKNYKKALFFIIKMETQGGNGEELKEFFEVGSAIKILATAKNNPEVNLLDAVQSFIEAYPTSKWLGKVKDVLK